MEQVKRVLITVGGTGGHVLPAMAFARKLKQRHPDYYIAFAGGSLSSNRHFDRQAFPYRDITCGALPLKKPFKSLLNLGRIALGTAQARRVLSEFRPDIVVGFGSYYTLPVLLAAKLRGTPFILHESNSIPGRVNRLLSRYALATGVQFPETARRLKGKAAMVALPIDNRLQLEGTGKETAREYFGLEEGLPTLLIFGGSQGAFALNGLAAEAMERFPCPRGEVQLLHFTGSPQQTEELKERYARLQVKACVKDFETQMALAWLAADLFLGRAGAATVAEAIAYTVPGILIPYPYATDDHQRENGAFLERTVKGAVAIEESGAEPERLAALFAELLVTHKEKNSAMRRALQEYRDSSSAQDLCTFVTEFI